MNKFNQIYNSITEQTAGYVSVGTTGIKEIDIIINILLKDQRLRQGPNSRGIDTAINVLRDATFLEAYKKTNPKYQKTNLPAPIKPSEADLNDKLEADRQSKERLPSAIDIANQQ
jgi:hypothetical protein